MLKYLAYVVILIVAHYGYTYINYEIRQRKQKARFANPLKAGPFGLTFVSEMMALSKSYRTYELFCDRAKKYGDTYGLWVFGHHIIVTNEPENIKAVLATQFSDFGGKGAQFKARWAQFLGDGIFNADGQSWSHARALMRPQFLKERVSTMENFEDKIQSVFKLIKPGQVTDVMDVWFRFTLDAATEHLFGHCADSLNATAEGEGFANLFARVQELQVRRDRRGELWRLPFWRAENKDFEQVLQSLDAYVDRYVQLALADKVDERDESLLAELARTNRDPVFLRDSLVSALLAGRDTTAATLTWLVMELSQDPALYQDLRKEVMDVLGTSEPPTYTQVKNFKLLQATINETLRMYPIVPFNIRASDRDTTLPRGGGPDGKLPIFVPANTTILYSALVMQRAQDIPDSEKWMPRRWIGLEGDKYTPAPWTYIPFNGGKNSNTSTCSILPQILIYTVRPSYMRRTEFCVD